ncbi:MAG: AEC family transporter [Defluviitaleaceae bacterium]|nr:AEC family transporter [Defluviitaleaceae bacterium]
MIQADNFSFLILILIAFLLVKAGFDTKAFDSIPKLLFNLCMPSLILVSFTGLDDDISQQDAVFIAVFAIAYTLAVYPAARYALRRYQNVSRRETLALNMVLGNISFVGLPFIAFFFGIWGVRLAILFSAIQDFFIWSFCYWIFAGKGSVKQTLKVIFNPCFVAIVLSFALAGMGLEIPALARAPVNMLADMTVPLALLCIGSLVAQNTGALRYVDRDAVISISLKTFMLPAIVFAALTAFSFDPALTLLVTFITALPVGLISVIFAKEFDKDIAFANVVFVLSTLLFILMCVVLFVFS